MSIFRNGGKFIPSTRPLYLCPHRRHRQSSCNDENVLHRRAFTASPSQFQLDTLSVTALPLPPQSSPFRRPPIRDELRQWSIKNEQKKLQEVGDEVIIRRGRDIRLPQTLFLDEVPNEDEGEDEEDLLDTASHGFNGGLSEDGDFDEYGRLRDRIKPGDLVFVSFGMGLRAPSLCLNLSFNPDRTGLWLRQNGSWSYSKRAGLHRQMPVPVQNFATADEIAHILKFLPKKPIQIHTDLGEDNDINYTGEMPKEASLNSDIPDTVVSRLRSLVEAAAAFSRQHIHVFDSIYERLADDDEFLLIPFAEIPRKLLGLELEDLDDATRLSISFHLMRHGVSIIPGHPTEQAPLCVSILPKKWRQQQAHVVEWARQYQHAAAEASKGRSAAALLRHNPLASFIDKARRIILKSRKIRSPTTLGCLGPSNQSHAPAAAGEGLRTQPSGEVFSEDDKQIIRFIWNTFAKIPYPRTSTAHNSIGSLILRAVGAYPNMVLDNRIGRLFLQELGTMPPWLASEERSAVTNLPNRYGSLSAKNTQLQNQVQEMVKGWPLNRADGKIPVPDTFSDIRRNLNSMVVLCVDLPSSVIIDDGYSLEPCDEKLGTWWIHVHVAHPSAFFDPDHPVSKASQAQGTSLYAADKTYMMINASLGKYLSLGPGAETMTISTLLNEHGEVLDVKLCPTRIQNVVRLDKRAVDREMGFEKLIPSCIIVGSDERFTPEARFDDLPEAAVEQVRQHLPLLRKLQELLQARSKQRTKEVPVAADFITSVGATKAVAVTANRDFDKTRLERSHHYLSDPTISVRALSAKPQRLSVLRAHENVTTMCMLLCGESVGKWFRDRDIPALFAGTISQPGWPVSKLNKMESGDLIQSPRGAIGTRPMPHVYLNMRQYARITSPLRRYPDLVVQWNADAYCRAEADGLIGPGASAKDLEFPFSRTDLNKYIKEDYWAIYRSENAIRGSYTHWAFQALFRAFHFKEAKLPSVWDVQIQQRQLTEKKVEGQSGLMGALEPFGLRCAVLTSPEGYEATASKSMFLPCKIELVDIVEGWVHVRPVGKPSMSLTQPEEVVISSPRGKEREEAKKEKVVEQNR